jgi:GTP pyrophosphokinase
MGDQVDVITSEYQVPQEKWFDFLRTSGAKSKLKNGIKEYRKSFKDQGKETLKEYFKKLNIEFSRQNRSDLAESLGLDNRNDLYYMVAVNKVSMQDVEDFFRKDESSWSDNLWKYFTFGLMKPSKKKDGSKNKENMPEYTIATCCTPIPGDDVVAISLPGEPMQIHHPDCPEAMKLMSRYGENIVKARMQFGDEFSFLATIKIVATNKIGFGAALFELVTNKEKLDMHSLEMKAEGGVVEAMVSVYVNNLKTLENLIDKIKRIDLVQRVERVGRRG